MKILIVEDELIIAQMLQEMLLELGYSDAQRCRKVEEAKLLIKSGNFDMAILDINLSGGYEGIELGQLCSQERIPFFFLTSYSDRNTVQKAKLGKPGNYVVKPFSPQDIMVAVELTLMHGQPETATKRETAKQKFGLTEREAEILELMLKRLSNNEIADQLFISINTVKSHMRGIYNKTGTSTKKELASFLDGFKT